MPMGLKNSPPIFQRNMNEAFTNIPYVQVFVDDVFITSTSVEQHSVHLKAVFDRMKEQGLMVKGRKFQLYSTRLIFWDT